VRWRAKNAGDRPEPLKIRGRAAFFINPTHGKFAAEEGVVAAVFVCRRVKAGRAKRETHALLPTAHLPLNVLSSPGRQRAHVRPEGSQRARICALHFTHRSAHAAAPTSFAAKSSATSARRVRSTLRPVSRIPPAMVRRLCRPVKPLERSRHPGHHPSLVPALPAPARAIADFGSRRRSLVNLPIVPVLRRR